MNHAAERMLDITLEEQVGGLCAPDLREALLDRIRAEPRRKMRLRVAGVAGALLLVAVVILGMWLADDPAPPQPPIGAAEVARMENWLRELKDFRIAGRPHTEEVRELERRCFATEVDLLDFLEDRPEAWSSLRPLLDDALLDDALRGAPRAEFRARIVRIYSRDPRVPRSETDTILSAQVTDHGRELDQRTLIVLAERGVGVASEALLAAPPTPGLDFLPSALWLAQHGPQPVQQQSRLSLELGLTMTPLLEVQPHAWMACALVLHRGGNTDAWHQAWVALDARVNELIDGDDDDVASARRLVLMLAWFHSRRRQADTLSIGDLRRTIRHHVQDGTASLQDATAIKSRLEQLER